MGTFSIKFILKHPVHQDQQVELEGLVDTGALFTQVPADVVARMRITPSGVRAVHYADGTKDVVPVAKADIAINGTETATMVLLGRAGFSSPGTRRIGISLSLPEGERPRERLLRQGAQTLTDAEIIAILLRVGMKGTSAVELARQILKKFGSLRGLAEAPLSALLDIKGLKDAKATQLAAAMELTRRISLPDGRKQTTLKSTREAAITFDLDCKAFPMSTFGHYF